MMTAADLQATLGRIGADYVKRLDLRVDTVTENDVTLSLPVTRELVHAGGVLCGQAVMSAADTAMLLAMIAKLGEFRPMTTVQWCRPASFGRCRKRPQALQSSGAC